MNFASLPEYRKDLKVLSKKYRTLEADMDVIRKVLTTRPDEHPPFSYRIDDLGIVTCIIKVKKIASRSLKGRGVQSGFRLIYAVFSEESRIVFVELYHKSEKASEDRDRILGHFK